jgi:nucleobase:cation symporter-1, NCS1 family
MATPNFETVIGPLSAGPSPAINEALGSLSASERVFGWHTHAALWFSLGVGLLVMQMGAYLVPATGTRDAVLAIVLGTALGAGLLAWTAKLAADSGLTSAGLMHRTFGSQFARLPVLLNIIQLVGWTTFELVIMRDGTLAIATQSLGLQVDGFVGHVLTTMLWGALLALMLSGSMTRLVRKIIGRYGLPLVLASLLWLSWQFGAQVVAHGWGGFMSRTGDGSMGLLSAMDLVIAMPVSWLPLVADYARFGKSGKGAFAGTWFGYAVANIWCYALGVLVASVSAPDTDLVATLLLAQGGLIALSLILVDEIDNAYGDVYSGAVSSHSLLPRWSIRHWGMGLALVCTGLAVLLPMRGLEPFLLILSSVFVPLYGVILGRLGFAASTSGASFKIDYVAAAIWLAGIAVFQLLTQLAPQWGATLPTLLLTGVAARASYRNLHTMVAGA